MKKKIVILGSTGSIGDSTLKVIQDLNGMLEVVGISAAKNVKKLAQQAKLLKCKYASISNQNLFKDLKESLPSHCKALAGQEGMVEMVSDPTVDFVLCGIVGTAGLMPVLEAIKNGKDIGLASKEILVMAGELVMNASAGKSTQFLPIDSEHSAIFQCLDDKPHDQVNKVILTCSGGPFRETAYSEFSKITKAQALNHPTWEMGAKITIDSATLMNKALEIIEARWLFNLPEKQIDVVIHPESIIHSLVEFIDGSVLAQLGTPDMVLPIQYALTYPEKFSCIGENLDFTKSMQLNFVPPDEKKFPSLQMARDVLNEGGTMPAVFNTANEVAVAAFLKEKISFMDIWKIVEKAISSHKTIHNPSLKDILEVEKETYLTLTEKIGY